MKKIYSILMFGTLLLILGFTQQISAQKTFVHPGIPFTQSDLNQLKVNITQEPWLTGYNSLKNDNRSKLTYTMSGPFANVTRSPDLNNGAWKNDMVAIHNLTFMYVFTGDAAYAAKATQILDAWAVTNTTWGGGENMLDIGDYAPYFITAADILKSTYPGWTADNTTHVNNYFANVLYPASWVPNPLRDCNKGAIQLQIALGIAAFLDDEVKWNQAIEVYRMDAGAALRNSIPSGQIGDTGRDDHWFGQAWALTWDAEVAFKQGVDMFAEMNNRLLAIGELYNHYAIDPTGLTFTPYGGYSVYWTGSWGIATGARHQHPFNNIIQGAYSLRKGVATPYTDQMRTLVGEGAWSFLYLKSSDTSTATPMTPIVYPSENVVPSTYFSNMDIGNTGIKGSASYNAGTWTVKGAGMAAANSNNFTFKPVKGDVAIVAKIENNSISNAVSGLMIRESLSTTSNYVSINFNPPGTINVSGSGSTASSSGYTHYSMSSSWWLKLERVGNRVFAYHSADGTTWTNIALFVIPLPTDAYIGFYTASRNTSALNTATFSNVAINNTFAVGSPEINSAAVANATMGTPFNFNVTATGTPTTYAATGLPDGLSIDATTGVISGTPITIAKNVVLLEATNASGTGKSALVIDVISNQSPVGVSNLAVSSANSIIKLTWTATANATSYSVKRSLTSGGPYTTIQTGITGTSYTDPTPAYEVNNYYIVTALIGENESIVSNEVFGSIPPAVPSNIVAVSSNGKVDLTWNTADGASTYKIKRATTSGGPYSEIASVSTNAYADTNVSNGTAYYYVITSKGNTLESTISSEVFGNPGTNSSTWNGSPTSNVFNVATDWIENTVPASPAILTFKNTETSTLTNDITGLVTSRIQFTEDAVNYTIGGNSITVKSDLINNSSQPETLTMPIVLDGQLNVNAKTNSIELSGIVSGTGSLLKTGTSALVMSGANTYSGNTIISGTTGYKWGSTDGIQVLGVGTGTSGAPTSGPLGTGKIIMEGGALYTGLNTAIASLYNDIEVPAGKSGFFYERMGNLNLYGKLLGGGTFTNDGSDNYAAINLYGNNSSFTGTFITKLRSGNHRMAFMVPESGSANAAWLLDAVGSDCHRIMFGSGALEFGSLSGRGGIRCNVAGTPVIRIGALNTNTNFSGTIANASGTLSVEKVGTGTLTFSGNCTFGGTTTVLNGTFLLNNSGSTGTYNSPIIAKNGSLGGNGKSTNSITIGTGSGTGALLVPGTNGTIGTLTTTGLATLNTDATYKVDMNSTAVSCDKLVAGSITLNQPILVVNDIVPGSLPLGTTFTILDNTGTNAVTGIFKNLPELALLNIGGYDFRITYIGGTGNDIQLLDERTMPVVITSSVAETTLVDKPFAYTITGIKSPNSFNATGLPAGLSIDSTTGVISGIPTEYGIFSVTLTASNGDTTATQTLALTVQDIVVSNVIVAAGDAKNIVEWEPIQDFSYNIKRSTTSGGPFTAIGSITGTKYTDTAVTNGSTYYYVVASVDNIGENPNSKEVVATPNTGQITYLKLDEQSVTRAIDSWGANHGTLAATASRNVGKYDQALKLDGTTNAYASLPTGIVSTLSDFTISSWVKMDALANWMRVFDFGTGTSKYMFLSVQTGSAGSIRYAIKNGGSEQGITYTFATPLNTWTHFAVTQSGNTCRIYINGTLVATSTSISIKPSTIGSTNQNYLGKSQWNDPMFKGSIDEFKIYSRALSAAEIAESSKLSQTIALKSTLQKEMGNADFSPATATSGLPVNYTSSNTAVANIVNGKLHIVAPGTSTITASQDGNADYRPAQLQTQILTVVKKNQTIDFAVIGVKSISDADFNAGATTSSGLAVSYTCSNTDVATIINGQIHIVGAGYAEITASQVGNDTYNAATSVTQPLTVNKAYYADRDLDGFGSITIALFPVNEAPEGYATNNTDCNDSDATVHEPILYYVDADHDGFGSKTEEYLCSSVAPEGYATNNTDCNDSDATVHEPILYYVDADHDGFGSTTTAMLCASIAPTGYATNNTDCNDSDASVHEPILYYVDADKDGFGSNTTAMLCASIAPEGYATNNTDCNDGDASVHEPILYYVDADKDGFGSTTEAYLCSSIAPEGYATNNTDCNDSDTTVHEPILYYVDADHDGFGSTTEEYLCSSIAPEGYATNNTDCNDSDTTVHEPILYYVDADHDGFGSTTEEYLCSSVAPEGYATNNLDCDDSKILYADNDGDGLGAGNAAACGVENNNDCDDTNPNQLIAIIPDVYALNAAVDKKNTIYIGYGPTSLSITANPTGGTAPYTYKWSSNETSQSIAVSLARTYTVIITDAKGCQTSVSIVINTINVQCGNSGDKVMVCHNNQEICVSSNAVQSHLDHGDKLGSCKTSSIVSKTSSKVLISEENTVEDITVYPNPVTSLLNIKVSEVHSGAKLELYNSLGMKVQSQALTSTLEVMSLDRLPSGIYFLNITNGNEITVKKIIKE